MKKILLLAASLVLSVGAWAQGTLELQPSTENVWEHQYRLHARNENGNYWLTSGLHSGNEAAAGKFAFVEQGTTNNYYVYSVDEGMWLTYTDATNGAHKITLSDTKSAYFTITKGSATSGWGDKSGYTLKASSANVFMNFYEGPTKNNYQTDGTIGFWKDQWNDAGSVWVLESAGASTSPFDSSKEYVLKNVADNRGYVAYNPANEKYVGLADVGYTQYASKHAQSSNPEVGIKWRIIPVGDNKVKLYNIKKGQFMNVTKCDGRDVFEWSATGYEFVYEVGDGYFAFKGNGNPNANYLCPAPAYDANKGPVVLDKNTMKNEYKFIIEEPKDGYTLHVGEAGYATLYLDKNVTIPSGVKVYYCPEEWSDYVLKTEEISSDKVLPSHTAYIVEATEKNHDYFFPYTEAEGEKYVNVFGLWGCASNAFSRKELTDLCKSTWDLDITNFYVLSVVKGKLGFYRYIGNEFALNKAFYFHPTSLANDEVQGYVLDFGGQTTGINNLNANVNANGSYDLQGRRVSKATRGLFIQNGVKVIR